MASHDPMIANDILMRIFTDMQAGEIRDVDDYIAVFPDHEDTVRREHAALTAAAVEDVDDAGDDDDSDEATLTHLGSYDIVRELGRSGQATVFEAVDRGLDRAVALKVLHPRSMFSGSAAMPRFLREAEAAARLDHAHIAGVYELGQDAGHVFIAMELVSGRSLFEVIRTTSVVREGFASPAADDATLPSNIAPNRFFSWFTEIAEALAHAHDQGVVHRDIKPSNIMIDDSNRAVLLDFGLAADGTTESTNLTRTGDQMGTPAYMSPEQVRSEPTDHRTDIYSLGVALYEALTGHRLFESESRDDMFRAILNGERGNFRTALREHGNDVIAIVEVATAAEPHRRYESAAAMAADLHAVTEGRPVTVRRASMIERVVRWTKRRPAAAALVFVLTAGSLGLAGLIGRTVARRPDVERARIERRQLRTEQRLFDAYHRLIADRDAIGAVRDFRELVRETPKSVEAVAGWALALIANGANDEAVAVLDAWSAVDGGDGRGRRALATIRAQAAGDVGVVSNSATSAREDVGAGNVDADDSDDVSAFVDGMSALIRHRLAADDDDAAGAAADANIVRVACEGFRRAILRRRTARLLYDFALCHAASESNDVETAHLAADIVATRWNGRGESRQWRALAYRRADPEASRRASEGVK